MSTTMDDARDMLARVFGHRDFIGKQAEVIEQLLAGKNALALMPTGGGKSLCYQLPALMLPGTAVVVSPLIALMKDQVDGLAQYNIRAGTLNSSQRAAEARDVKERLAAGDLDLLYIAPERLMGGDGLSLLRGVKIALVAIDEAHCISQWGHDFRPEYMQLGELANLLPDTPRLALTATADARTRQEIIDKLHLEDAHVAVASFDRSNIRYHIRPKENTRGHFLQFYRAEHSGQSGIIYCLSRRRAEETAEWLDAEGISALPYHAGMTADMRDAHQERFLREDGMVICATVAFGMGINKPDVRFVAHFDLPKSVESYYQETGRAGRDGLPANAMLYYSNHDAHNIRRMIDDGDTPENIRRIEHQKLNALTALCDSHNCRRALLLDYFGEPYTPPCDNCDNCLTPPELEDGTVAAQKLLSAAARSRQRFGAGHLVDILIGKESEKILRFSHNTLSTFGVGKDKNATEWRRIARQLTAHGLLQPDGEYGVLKITDDGWQVLRGERQVQLRRAEKRQPRENTRARPARTQPAAMLDARQTAVFEALRGERQRLARAQNVPAYIVFHDTVLLELARSMPTTAAAFANIPGVGAAKAERYAKPFLKVIKEQEEAAGTQDKQEIDYSTDPAS